MLSASIRAIAFWVLVLLLAPGWQAQAIVSENIEVKAQETEPTLKGKVTKHETIKTDFNDLGEFTGTRILDNFKATEAHILEHKVLYAKKPRRKKRSVFSSRLSRTLGPTKLQLRVNPTRTNRNGIRLDLDVIKAYDMFQDGSLLQGLKPSSIRNFIASETQSLMSIPGQMKAEVKDGWELIKKEFEGGLTVDEETSI